MLALLILVEHHRRGTAVAYLAERYRRMPRTTLRYAIEKLPEEGRQRYLQGEA